MKNLKYYFQKAQKEKFAIGQFNFSTKEQFHGIVQAAKNLNSPVILGTSESESKFFGMEEAVALRNVLRKKTGLPIFLNLDHGKSFDYLKQAINAGYDMVHFDGSKLPLDENIKITKQVKSHAKWRGVLVEGEVGRIEFETKEENLTKPEEAKKFVDETAADLLAVSIGNIHGIEAFGVNPCLRLDKLAEIAKQVGVPLVLHGGSGTQDQDIQEAIKTRIVKINVNTELRAVFSSGLRRALVENPDEIVPYKYLPEAQKAVENVVDRKIKLFDSANKI